VEVQILSAAPCTLRVHRLTFDLPGEHVLPLLTSHGRPGVNGNFKVTGFGQLKVPTSGCSGLREPTTSLLGGARQRTASSACLPHPERFPLGDDHDRVVEEALSRGHDYPDVTASDRPGAGLASG
jgi:hypothetical protein